MSFDMAVWEGVRPSTDAEGLAEFNRLHARSLEGGASVEPSARMKKFIAAITEKYPDIVDLPDDLVDDGVWSDGPLENNASGPYFYFGIVWSRAGEVAEFVADVAREHGLVCFDPQSGELR
jgi:hypothetical protein